MVIDNKKDERLTNFRLLVSWKAYKDLNLEDRLWYVQKMREIYFHRQDNMDISNNQKNEKHYRE